MSATAHMWGGEGTYTRTGWHRARNVDAPAPAYLQPLFATDELWHECFQDNLDAPSHIARGGVIAYQFADGSTTLFASEPRP